MRIFIDSANIETIRSAITRGLVSGCTINPSLLAKEPKTTAIGHVVALLEAVPTLEELHIQVPTALEFMALRKEIKSLRHHIIAKAPVNRPQLLKDMLVTRCPVNATCVFTEAQAIAAAAMGARFVSFFWGRMLDAKLDPANVVKRTRAVFERQGIRTSIVAGSLRNPEAVVRAFDSGADIATTSLSVIEKMFEDEDSEKSLKGFEDDYAAWMSQ